MNGETTSKVYNPYGDNLKWIRTAKQLADPFTKSMKPDDLLKTFDTGLVDIDDSSREKGRKNVS